jgi:hypothetical protein
MSFQEGKFSTLNRGREELGENWLVATIAGKVATIIQKVATITKKVTTIIQEVATITWKSTKSNQKVATNRSSIPPF